MVATFEARQRLQNLDYLRRKWHDMRRTCLHALGRNGPKLLLKIKLSPACMGDLALTLSGQCQQAQQRAKGVAHRLCRLPDGAKLKGAGTLQIKEPERAADLGHGAEVYSQTCGACHGADGLGQRAEGGAGYRFPPLWGPDSFNNGAGMSRLLTAAAYARHNMPAGTTYAAPVLTDEEAYDVAGYLIAQKRPEKANLDEDFPVRLQKPIDTPYGPFADGFRLEHHELGPFGPIRKKVQKLAAAHRIPRAAGPDNGSDESGRKP